MGAAVVAAWVVVATVGATDFSVNGRSDVLDVQQASVDTVLAELPDDATIVSIEAPQPLVLSRGVNPTEHQMFDLGLEDYVDATWPGGTRGLRRRDPRGRADTAGARHHEPGLAAAGARGLLGGRHGAGLDLVRAPVRGTRGLRPAGRGHRRPPLTE